MAATALNRRQISMFLVSIEQMLAKTPKKMKESSVQACFTCTRKHNNALKSRLI